ncbi:MAG TPA: amidohydrolase family protein [Vicinamibacterales bacterium]
MIRYHAAWVLPIAAPPLRDGWVVVDGGRVVAVGGARHDPAEAGSHRDDRRESHTDDRGIRLQPDSDEDLGNVAILPGLVNAHTHLELSYLRDQVPPAGEFVTWIRRVMAARRERPDARSPEIFDGIASAIAECERCGTAVVGDISNTLVTFEPLARSPLAGVVFYELIRFNAPDPRAFVEQATRQLDTLMPTARLRCSLAAHAPYSVAPAVLRAIRESLARHPALPASVHLSESAEEVEFIRSASGSWRALLEDIGSWDPAFVAPGGTPVEYLDAIGFLDDRVLAVHAVQATVADLQRLAARGATLVTCPRSNGHTGAGAPPLEEFYASGVRVAVGTDSLASAPDLNVFAELATARALAPTVPAASLLESATRSGAAALGFAGDYGTIEPGRRARLIAVTLPDRLDDVEEYLVSGIEPEQIRWIE